MKIKYFTGEVDVKNSEALGDYLIDDLGYANDPAVQAYADLIFKIHEKIEEHEKDVIRFNNDLMTTGEHGYDIQPREFCVKELKSLIK